jgi:hypothetical protein
MVEEMVEALAAAAMVEEMVEALAAAAMVEEMVEAAGTIPIITITAMVAVVQTIFSLLLALQQHQLSAPVGVRDFHLRRFLKYRLVLEVL